MKYLYLLLVLLCGTAVSSAQVTKIKDAGPQDARINFVVLGDGYTATEMGKFNTDALGITADFFNEPPFLQYTNFFNVYSIEVESEESGADHPNIENSISHPFLEVNTAFDAGFDRANIHRLVLVNGSKVRAVLAEQFPDFDQSFVVVNSPFYGGGGGVYPCGTTEARSSEVALHEVGHSFMSLADEYFFRRQERANQTDTSNAGNTRWNDWIGINGIGEFRHGFTGDAATQLKPKGNFECKMAQLSQPFCSVCTEQTIQRIYSKVSPLEATFPETNLVEFTGEDLPFSINSIKPIPNTLTYEWELDGNLIAEGVEEIVLSPSQITEAFHTVLVRLQDTTNLSKKNANYVFTYEWNIARGSLPVVWGDFTASAVDKINQLDWYLTEAENSSHFLVERRGDNSEWTTLQRVNFTGLTNYRYFDELPLPGTNYYRIRGVDFDDTFTDSPIRQVRNISRYYFKVYPSITDGPVMTEAFTEGPSETEIVVFSAAGQLVKRQVLSNNGGWVNQRLDFSAYPPGAYTIRLTSGREVHTQQVIRR